MPSAFGSTPGSTPAAVAGGARYDVAYRCSSRPIDRADSRSIQTNDFADCSVNAALRRGSPIRFASRNVVASAAE